MARWIVRGLFVAALCIAMLIASGAWQPPARWMPPDRWLPWQPLRFEDAPNLLTRYKLARLSAEPEACLAFLGHTPLRMTPLDDRETGNGCGFENAVRITRTSYAVGSTFTLSCPAAASLALWERHVVTPAAERLYGSPPVRLEHYGSYACRNVAGSARRSRHATADALDVAGFTLKNGTRIRVQGGWDGSDGLFLREVHRGGCRFFGGVLGPDYNAAHADHLHLEVGGFGICR